MINTSSSEGLSVLVNNSTYPFYICSGFSATFCLYFQKGLFDIFVLFMMDIKALPKTRSDLLSVILG